ncbi:sulfotransferase [Reinekea thalattae]|uniref:Sulfotransferase n=1 Tax=Reinekea thalattae TaxID=2593301 RepID=A0A5C8ZAJ3_9GAMM|nr:sulfotransferase [Reinekea thalattae]TXR53916.1 sulfotransferase [Reinekea thalattae]
MSDCMIKGALQALLNMARMLGWSIRSIFVAKQASLLRRLVIFLLVVPLFIALQLLHWFGFLLDEILFRAYRKQKTSKIVFVTGIPRSGTTHLQRVLAQHEQLTSMTMWECVFAPSISERYFYSTIGRLIKPLNGALSKINIPFIKNMHSVHKLGLQEAEEDFIALLPINACFLMVLLFPEQKHFWQLSQFDQQLSANSRKAIMSFYRRLIQKHLYFHGADQRYLCKNPSFLTWVATLREHFHEASFLVCQREAEAAVPSQISSLNPAWQAAYGCDISDAFSQRLIEMMAGYYHYLESPALQQADVLPIAMADLVKDLNAVVELSLQHCQLDMTPAFAEALQREVAKARAYKSGHSYNRSDFALFDQAIGLFPKKYLKHSYNLKEIG